MFMLRACCVIVSIKHGLENIFEGRVFGLLAWLVKRVRMTRSLLRMENKMSNVQFQYTQKLTVIRLWYF